MYKKMSAWRCRSKILRIGQYNYGFRGDFGVI